MTEASAGDAPPSAMPTNAPEIVTRPTVQVWSMDGTRAVYAAARQISILASYFENPRDRAASASP